MPNTDRYRSQKREVVNRNTIVTLALGQGFNVFLPVYDGGIDFIFYHEGNNDLRHVQLKSRWAVHRKYIGRGIWIAFPISGEWYLVPHDKMVNYLEAKSSGTSVSWTKYGSYSSGKPSKATIEAFQEYRFGSVGAIASIAAAEAEASGNSD